ncbi:hypothetical protein A8924_2797 [Saccharopolyspora erythraea NRRL 2338]|nr:hypothetical protein A8924_2797 [Saccharopolyspora erythraea NRRL 2338]
MNTVPARLSAVGPRRRPRGERLHRGGHVGKELHSERGSRVLEVSWRFSGIPRRTPIGVVVHFGPHPVANDDGSQATSAGQRER